MTNVRKIHVDWYGQYPPRFNGGPQLAYQGDHLSNMVVFDNAPELPNYYLLVNMKTDDAGQVVDLPAILLEGPYWVIPNYYTQICQQITYQVCCKTGTNDYEHHSAKFKGTILPVIKHNGEPIDQSPMFDPYIDILDKRVDELIVAAGDIQIDSELKNDSTNPVQNKIVKAAIDDLTDDVDAVNGRLTHVYNVAKADDSNAIAFNVEISGYGLRVLNDEQIYDSYLSITNYIDVSLYSKILYKRIGSTGSSPVCGMLFYDSAKSLISGERAKASVSALGYVSEMSELDVPENAVYARFTLLSNTETYGSFEVNGISKLSNELKSVNERINATDDLLSLKGNVAIQYKIAVTGKYVQYSTGAVVTSSPYSCTDYIDISKYAFINYKRITSTVTSTVGMAFYDGEKQYISGVQCVGNRTAGYMDAVAEIPSEAIYARFTVLSDVATYGEFSATGETKLFAGIYQYTSPYQKNVIFGCYSSDWYKAQGESYNGFTVNTLYADMIDAWNELVTNGKGYITKAEIGTSSDNQTMYCYKLIPTRYRNNTGSAVVNNPPTFLIVPSLHGYEKSAAYGTYYFAKDLVYNFDKSPVLNSIRTKCALYIVPVGNPWGFDNKQRKNANGVDLNRNWGVDPTGETDPTAPYYPGAEPFDQPETQAIKSVIDSASNLFFLVDYHTNGQVKASSWANVNWMDCPHVIIEDKYFEKAYIAGQIHISEITENLSKEYNLNTNGESIGSITLGSAGGRMPTIGYYARTQNVMGFTFEGNNGLPSESSSYSDMEQKINSELIGNWVKNLLLVFKDASLV